MRRNQTEFGVLTNKMHGASVTNLTHAAVYPPIVITLASLATGLALAVGGMDMLAGIIPVSVDRLLKALPNRGEQGSPACGVRLLGILGRHAARLDLRDDLLPDAEAIGKRIGGGQLFQVDAGLRVLAAVTIAAELAHQARELAARPLLGSHLAGGQHQQRRKKEPHDPFPLVTQ